MDCELPHHSFVHFKEMIGEACQKCNMTDCEFFIHKHDYLQLKVNVPHGEHVELYGFIFDGDDCIPEEDVVDIIGG